MSTPARRPRVPSTDARSRILQAARDLLRDGSWSDLTIGAVMARAGLARTVFYRHFDDLAQLAPDLLPDADDPLVDQVRRSQAQGTATVVRGIVEGLVGTFADHGPLLRAIDDASRSDAAVASRLDVALVGPRALIAELLAAAPHPPPDPAESARLLQAAHRAYLLDRFGDGSATPASRAAAIAALEAMWARLLDEPHAPDWR